MYNDGRQLLSCIKRICIIVYMYFIMQNFPLWLEFMLNLIPFFVHIFRIDFIITKTLFVYWGGLAVNKRLLGTIPFPSLVVITAL